MKELLEIMERLRGPKGCPWDREQNHMTIRSQLIAECYELVDAIETLDDRHMKEELGDVLLQVVFHAQLAKERRAFNFDDVVDAICEKLVRRHPHVFDKKFVETSSEVLGLWHEIKKKEKPERGSAVEGVPKHLPSLMQAQEIQKKAARVGFDWKKISPVFGKLREEISELENTLAKKSSKKNQRETEEELGDLFFSLVNLSRHLKIDAEQACRSASKKFVKRFQRVEEKMKKENVEMRSASLEVLDRYWEAAKRETDAKKAVSVKHRKKRR